MPNEHSLEVHLPFLKLSGEKFSLVPLMMGHQNPQFIQILYEALVKVLKGKNFLIVASSDLSHFYTDSKARELDRVVMDDISDFSPEQLQNHITEHKCEMCGYGPAITAMKVARDFGAENGRVLLYRNSGDVTGNKREVVGYLAGIFY
jgi:AmmeMemoRadiSam system protein B